MGVKEGYLLTGVRFILDSGENILKLDSGDGCRTLLLLSLISRVRLCVTPWTAAYQAHPSMGIFQARVLEWVAIAFSQVLSTALIIPEALF